MALAEMVVARAAVVPTPVALVTGTTKKNNLIFMPIVGSDEVRIFDELKAIPQEEYAGFIGLFNSSPLFKNKIFSGFKSLWHIPFL